MAQLAGGEPLSPEYLIRSTPTVLPFGLRNVIETVGHLMEQRMIPFLRMMSLWGVIEHVAESFHDLLVEESKLPSSSDSSRGSHHPSHECFMAGTPEGYVESIHKGEATPRKGFDNKVEGDVGAPPCLGVE